MNGNPYPKGRLSGHLGRCYGAERGFRNGMLQVGPYAWLTWWLTYMPRGADRILPMNVRPAHGNELAATLLQAWHLLSRAAHDRQSPLRTPMLATVGTQGEPAGGIPPQLPDGRRAGYAVRYRDGRPGRTRRCLRRRGRQLHAGRGRCGRARVAAAASCGQPSCPIHARHGDLAGALTGTADAMAPRAVVTDAARRPVPRGGR